MKTTILVILFLFIFQISSTVLLAQKANTVDTTLVHEYFEKALAFNKAEQTDSAIVYFNRSSKLALSLPRSYNLWAMEKHLSCLNELTTIYINNQSFSQALMVADSVIKMAKKNLGDSTVFAANAFYNRGLVYYYNSRPDETLGNWAVCLAIRKKMFGENHILVANLFNNIGLVYENKDDYDKALVNHFKSMGIYKYLFTEKNSDVADSYNSIGSVYWYKSEFGKALEYYFKSLEIRKELFGEKSIAVANSYKNITLVYYNTGKYEQALEYGFKSLSIRRELYGEKHTDVADTYISIGNAYWYKAEYDKALEFFLKSLDIRKELLGEKSADVAGSYFNIGMVYINKADYDKALEYCTKGLAIQKELKGEKNAVVARFYNTIGVIYQEKAEYDKSLEFCFKGLAIEKELFGENYANLASYYKNIGNTYYAKAEYDKALEYHLKSLAIEIGQFGEKDIHVAGSYMNIGNVYYTKTEYDKALDYNFKGLTIRVELLGEKNATVANSYNNIGNIYSAKLDYEKALEYSLKSLAIRKEVFGEDHTDVAMSYNSLADIYSIKSEFDKALEYCFKSLAIKRKLLGEKHTDLAISYRNAGQLYSLKKEYQKALIYYQKSLAANLRDFEDTTCVYCVPGIINYIDWIYLLEALLAKAEILTMPVELAKDIPGYNSQLEYALKHYQAADTLITQVRKSITSQSDKISLGEKASSIYNGAIGLCMKLAAAEKLSKTSYYNGLSLYFSEQNKSMVLLEALAGAEGMRFAGLPDSLLDREHNLKTGITLYEKKLAEGVDSLTEVQYHDKLFTVNRQYEELISTFEKNYPEYFNLKYSTSSPSTKEIQNALDEKTAIRSYFVGDDSIYIFTITRKKLNVREVPRIKYLNDSITWFRYGLTRTSTRMQEYYRRIGFSLYQQLFPDSANLDKRITNLIIIPDGNLATIPFESLLTNNYTGNIDDYRSYPFLIKKYNISYSYSASLIYRTFSKNAASTVKMTNLNDWLALAPVFDGNSNQGIVITTSELQRQLGTLKTDTLMPTRAMFDRSYISPLPATENETQTILRLYEDNSLKSRVLLHNEANEQFIKSGGLGEYKILHFATHGFVNSERPELSGILLAQDTTGGQDGILYSGEIYNLRLNADLVVLSACETGLGKIQKGEGIIGLTRALLYAGAKNIIVSLWQVADQSTSDLMVDFYKNAIVTKQKPSYSNSLRTAKLKMISEGKFSHPLYWSPFILIGK